VRGGVERTARHADDPPDLAVAVEGPHERLADLTGGTRYRDGETRGLACGPAHSRLLGGRQG
jgi:hypothetical protein